MFNYEEMKERHLVLREFYLKYRKELTVYAGVVGEYYGKITYEDYIKFSNELSDDEFVGNYLGELLTESIDICKQILDGEMPLEELFSYAGYEILNTYKEKIANC